MGINSDSPNNCAQPTMNDPLSDKLVYQDNLALSCSIVDWPMDPAALLDINQQNIQLLEALLILGEILPELEEPKDQVLQEIRYLDVKINLMLSWLGTLMNQQQDRPATHSIHLCSAGLAFDSDNPVGTGEDVMLDIYLSEQFPQPLRLPASVISSDKCEQYYTVVVYFQGLSEQVTDLLDKFVFRQHRRLVAMSRHQ